MKKLSHLVSVVFFVSVATGISWWLAKEGNGSGPVSQAVADTTKVQSPGAESIAAIKQTIQQRFAQARPELVISDVEASQIPGLYSVKVKNGPVVYATADGVHFIMGDLFQVQPGGFVNIAEQAREGDRAKAMAAIDVADMIVFAPKDQPSKAVINVFTDVDCYYCQKLHNQMNDMNRVGIEVRYLAFPRAGIGSESYKKIASAWCAKDQQAAMTKLKRRQDIERNVCKDNPVKEQYDVGQKIGVNGTPALITAQGRLMPGYMPTLKLAQELGVEVAPDIASELMRKWEAEKQQKR